jgi:hypothetical protein
MRSEKDSIKSPVSHVLLKMLTDSSLEGQHRAVRGAVRRRVH